MKNTVKMPGCYITGQKESHYYVENTVKVKQNKSSPTTHHGGAGGKEV
jgi:hypothetical protein